MEKSVASMPSGWALGGIEGQDITWVLLAPRMDSCFNTRARECLGEPWGCSASSPQPCLLSMLCWATASGTSHRPWCGRLLGWDVPLQASR